MNLRIISKFNMETIEERARNLKLFYWSMGGCPGINLAKNSLIIFVIIINLLLESGKIDV